MDWIEGYRISDKSLYSPSGAKIAEIERYYGSEEFEVFPTSPEIMDVDTNSAKSVEAACSILIHAHHQKLRVVPLAELQNTTINVAQQIVQVSGDNNQTETNLTLERQIKEADGKKLLQILKEATVAGAVTATGAAMLTAIKSALGG